MLVIFDCDGVLIDSECISLAIWVEMLAKLGLPHTLEKTAERFLGVSGIATLAILEKDFGGPLPDWFTAETSSRHTEAYAQHLKPIPGVVELLEQLPYPVCVASGSSIKRLEINLKHTALYDRLHPHIFSSEMVARSKPHPDIFLYAAKQMGFAPEDCLVIEDSINGVLAARAAGMACVGFTGGKHCDALQAERLQKAGAAMIFSDMYGVADFLRQNPL